MKRETDQVAGNTVASPAEVEEEIRSPLAALS